MSEAGSSGLPPEGWFPDDQGTLRWWDGVAWTDHTHDQAQSVEQSATARGVDRVRLMASKVVARPEVPDDDYLWQGQSQTLTSAATNGMAVKGRYRLTHEMLYFERGTLRTDAQQVPIIDVEDVDVKQSMTQKARGVGDVIVKIRRSSGIELVTMESIPQPRDAQQIINATARAARHAATTRQNTVRYEHLGVAPVASPQSVVAQTEPTRSSESDPYDQLRRLGELRDLGVLSDQEFDDKKKQILDRI